MNSYCEYGLVDTTAKVDQIAVGSTTNTILLPLTR